MAVLQRRHQSDQKPVYIGGKACKKGDDHGDKSRRQDNPIDGDRARCIVQKRFDGMAQGRASRWFELLHGSPVIKEMDPMSAKKGPRWINATPPVLIK